jgi:hypothetical protein
MKDLGLHFGHVSHVDALFRQIQAYFETEHEPGGGALRGPTRGDQALVVGIYGPWGAGKTTWLRALLKRARAQARRGGAATILVTVWFSAWRFEREPHLIIPLLKTADVAIKAAREREGVDESAREWLRGAGRMLGDIIVSLVAATSVKTANERVELELKGAAFVETLSKHRRERQLDEKLASLRAYESLYYDLNRYLEALTGRHELPAQAMDEADEGGEHSISRWHWWKREPNAAAPSRPRLDLLFLIDDLDRCMPENAIKVLESIKLFFEIPGCAFVLAMDDMMIERGILHRYRDYIMPLSPHGELEVPPPLSGAEYLEKLVHLPIRVPKPSRSELRAFIEAEYHELLGELSTRSREILDLFVTCTPPNPRKVVRAVEAFRARHELANDPRYDPALLARLILIELFAPELHRFGQTERGGDYLWHLQQMRGRDLGEVIAQIEHELKHLPQLSDRAAYVRQVDALLAAHEVARLADAVRVGRTDFDPRRVVDLNVELRAGPVLRYHQRLTAFEDEPTTHDRRPSAPEPENPRAHPSTRADTDSQLQIPEHERFAVLALSDDGWDRVRAREMLEGSLIPETYFQALLEAVRTNREAIDIAWFELFAPNLDYMRVEQLASNSGLVARLMSDPERVRRRSDDLRRFLTVVSTTANPAYGSVRRTIPLLCLLPGRDPIDLSPVTLAHAYVRGVDFGALILPVGASAWAGVDLREVHLGPSPTAVDCSTALTKLESQPGLSLPKGAGRITSIITQAGERIVTGGADGVVRLWSAVGELLDQRFGHNHPIVALAGDVYEQTWSIDERGEIRDPRGHRRVGLARPILGWAPLVVDAANLTVAVLTSRELVLVVVEGEQRAEHWTSWTHEGASLTCVAAFDDYRSGYVVVGDESGALHVLSYDESQLRTAAKGSQASHRDSMPAHDGPIVSMSASGYELFTVGPRGRLQAWNISDRGLERRESQIDLPESIASLAAGARSNRATDGLLIGLNNGEVHRVEFDHRLGTASQRCLGQHQAAVRVLAPLDTERFVCGGDRSVAVWARFGRELCVFPAISSVPLCLRAESHAVYTLDERGLLICWSGDNAYRRGTADERISRLEILDEMEMLGSRRRNFGLGRDIVHCYDDEFEVALELGAHTDVGAVGFDGPGLVTGDASDLRWWTNEGRLEFRQAHGASPVIGLARWRGDGGDMLSAHSDGELWVWNERRQVRQLPKRGPLRELVVSRAGIVAVLTDRAKIIWRIPHEPKHLEIEASHLVASQDGGMWALGLDRKIYAINLEGEIEAVAPTYQGRLTGIADLGVRRLVTSGADGTIWYWNEGSPSLIVASLGDHAVLSVAPDADWPISIRRDDRPWATEWRGSKVRVPVDAELHRLVACITRDVSRVDDLQAPSFRVPLHAYEHVYGELWRWADQNDPRQLQLRWPKPADARARLLRALFGEVPDSLARVLGE